VYIDGANLEQGSKSLGFHIDYNLFRKWATQKYGAEKQYIFLGLLTTMGSLYRRLQEFGYLLIFKQVIANKDGNIKGNCDAELVLTTVSNYYEDSLERAILVTGDGDFRCLIDFLVEKNVEVIVLAPAQCRCSYLIRSANIKIVFLDEHYQKFSRKEKAPRHGEPYQGSFS
jgi:uncharacterized LabA/DUF88 family protein